MPDSSIKRAFRWLGFIEDPKWEVDDDVDEEEETTAVYGDEVEYEHSSVTSLHDRRPVHQAAGTGATAAAPVRQPQPVPPVQSAVPQPPEPQRVVTVHPRTYNEARTIGEHFRDGVPVIMNLSDMEDGDAKRLVDFAAGLIFGLRGRIERVTSKVFLLSPQNVTVSADDKERIASGSFYNQS